MSGVAKKKVLFAGLAYYPNVGFGGPVRVMRSYGLSLRTKGHEVTILCSNIIDREHNRMAECTIETELEGIRVVYLRTDLLLSDGLTFCLGLNGILKTEITRYDVVHLFGPRDLFTAMVALHARKHDIPYVIQAMGSMNYRNSKVVFKKLWDLVLGRRIICGAQYVVEATQEQTNDLRAYGLPESKIAVVPWGPDPDLMASDAQPEAFRQRFSISNEERLLLFIGRVHRKKRLDLIIRALSLLRTSNVRVVVIGHDDDGSLASLRALAKSLNVEGRITWCGPLYSPESAAAYKASDVFLLPSDHESAPMAMLEALSLGIPVVISDHTGMSKLVHQSSGLVVEQTPEAIARATDSILKDDTLRQRYSAGARALIAKHFSSRSIGEQLEDLYGWRQDPARRLIQPCTVGLEPCHRQSLPDV